MGKNLIVSSEIVHNQWIDSTGTNKTSNYCMSTGYIPVTPGETISLSYWQPANNYTGNNRLWSGSPMYYNSSKTYVSGYTSTYTKEEYYVFTEVVPNNVAYVRATFQIPNGLGTSVATEIQQSWTIDSEYKWQLEKGQPTGWKPSREDGDSIEQYANAHYTISEIDDGIGIKSHTDYYTLSDKSDSLDGAKSYFEYDESGDIVSFDNGAEDAPLTRMAVNIMPKQDLHGYDYPWAPGCGTNLFDASAVPDENKYIRSDNGNLSTPGSTTIWHYTDYIRVIPGDVLYFGEDPSTATLAGTAYYNSNKVFVSGFSSVTLKNSSMVRTVPDGVTYMRHSFAITDAANINWQTSLYIVRNTDPHEWRPYANVCPIEGYDKITVIDDPLYAGDIEYNQYIPNFGTVSDWYCGSVSLTFANDVATITKPDNIGDGVGYARPQNQANLILNHVYFMSIDVQGTSGQKLTVFTNSYQTGAVDITLSNSNWLRTQKVFKWTAGAQPSVRGIAWIRGTGPQTANFKNYIWFDLTKMFGETFANEIYSLEQATAGAGVTKIRELFPKNVYEYNEGEKTTVSLVNNLPCVKVNVDLGEAGTIYRGTLDVIRGKLTITHKLYNKTSFTGSFGATSKGYAVYNSITEPRTGIASNHISNGFRCDVANGYTNMSVGTFCGSSGANTTYTFILPPSVTSLSEANTWLTNNFPDGLKITVKLPEPIVYDNLTPAEIRTFLGANNIWSDAGSSDLTYISDEDLTWSEVPLVPNEVGKYLWWKYKQVYDDDTEYESEPSVIGMFSSSDKVLADIEKTQKDVNTSLASIEVIYGLQTAATSRWTGKSERISELKDGLQITYWLPFSYSSGDYVSYTPVGGSAANGTGLALTLADGTTTDFIPCFYSGINRITSHYPAGNVLRLTYRENVKIGSVTVARGWWADANYTDGNTIDNVIQYFGGKTGAIGIWAYGLLMRDGNGTQQNICTNASGTAQSGQQTTATTKLANPNGFEVGSPIQYTSTGYNAGANISGSGVIYSQRYGLSDGRYVFNITGSSGNIPLQTYKNIYLVGEIHDDGLYYLDPVWWTQDPAAIVEAQSEGDPTKVFVLIGGVYDTYRYNLQEINKWMVYDKVSEKMVDYTNNLVALVDYASKQAQATADDALNQAREARSASDILESFLTAKAAADGFDSIEGWTQVEHVSKAELEATNEALTSTIQETNRYVEQVESDLNTTSANLTGYIDGKVADLAKKEDVQVITDSISSIVQTSDEISLAVSEHAQSISDLEKYTTSLKASMELTASGLDISGGDTSVSTHVHINGDGVEITDGTNTPAKFKGSEAIMNQTTVYGGLTLQNGQSGQYTAIWYIDDQGRAILK